MCFMVKKFQEKVFSLNIIDFFSEICIIDVMENVFQRRFFRKWPEYFFTKQKLMILEKLQRISAMKNIKLISVGEGYKLS